jgi:hypothetical protein
LWKTPALVNDALLVKLRVEATVDLHITDLMRFKPRGSVPAAGAMASGRVGANLNRTDNMSP